MVASFLSRRLLLPAGLAVAALLGLSLFGGMGVVGAQENDGGEVDSGSAPTEAPSYLYIVEFPWVNGYKRAATMWTVVGDADVTSYEVAVRPVGTKQWKSYGELKAGVRAFTWHYLNAGKAYEHRVRAVNADGAGPWSEVSRPEAKDQVMAPPSVKAKAAGVRGLAVADAGMGAADLSWQAPRTRSGQCSVIERYRYSLRAADAEWHTAKVGEVYDATSVTLEGLTEGRKYVLTLRAYSEECSNWSRAKKVAWAQ